MRLFAAVLAALFALVFGTASGFAERRVALVVGNDRYPNLTDREQLQKAVSDARAVGAAFRQLGFEVIAGENLTRQQFVDRLDQLVYRLSPGDVAAFFFSGHGVALEGMNYILPSDVPDLQSGQEIRLKGAAYAEQDIIDELRRRGVRVAVVVLDACRTNPLGRVGAKSLGGEKGLAAPREVAGVFSLYAASPGQAALDRLSDGDPDPNSVFTRVLVPALTRPGVDLIEMAKQVQEEVARLARTVQHDQLPAYLDRVQGREYLAGRPAQVGALNEDQRPPPAVFIPSAPANDERAWNLVSDSRESRSAATLYRSISYECAPGRCRAAPGGASQAGNSTADGGSRGLEVGRALHKYRGARSLPAPLSRYIAGRTRRAADRRIAERKDKFGATTAGFGTSAHLTSTRHGGTYRSSADRDLT